MQGCIDTFRGKDIQGDIAAGKANDIIHDGATSQTRSCKLFSRFRAWRPKIVWR